MWPREGLHSHFCPHSLKPQYTWECSNCCWSPFYFKWRLSLLEEHILTDLHDPQSWTMMGEQVHTHVLLTELGDHHFKTLTWDSLWDDLWDLSPKFTPASHDLGHSFKFLPWLPSLQNGQYLHPTILASIEGDSRESIWHVVDSPGIQRIILCLTLVTLTSSVLHNFLDFPGFTSSSMTKQHYIYPYRG